MDEANLLKRLQRAVTEGDLPRHVDPSALARYVGTVNFGLAVQAATGTSRLQLKAVVDAVMRTWPLLQSQSKTVR